MEKKLQLYGYEFFNAVFHTKEKKSYRPDCKRTRNSSFFPEITLLILLSMSKPCTILTNILRDKTNKIGGYDAIPVVISASWPHPRNKMKDQSHLLPHNYTEIQSYFDKYIIELSNLTTNFGFSCT